MAKTSKADALKRAGKILGRTFKVTKPCSTAGSKLASDSTKKKAKSKAGGNLASVYIKPNCKAKARRRK